MNRLQVCAGLLGFIASLSGCGTDAPTGSSTGNGGNEKRAITREDVEDSPFKPVELENTIEDLVEAINEKDPEEMQLNVVLKSLSNYWEPVLVGANRALGELNATGGVAAPQEETGQAGIDEQNAMLKEAREQGSRGFGIAPFEQGVAQQIDAAADEDIPVVTIDSDLTDSKRDIYIGTLNADAGKTAGKTLLEFLPEGEGTVVLLGHDDAGWVDGYQRTMGAKDVLEAEGYTVVVRRTDWDADVGEQNDLDALAEIFASADPPVVGMMGMFSNAYRCAIAAETAGRSADDIAIAAFDFDPKTVSFMDAGMIKATHAQRQYYMGYLTPYLLYGMNVLGKDKVKDILGSHMVDEHRFNSGLDVVGANQLDDYYSFLDNLGIGGS